jgi:hypothetical protein
MADEPREDEPREDERPAGRKPKPAGDRCSPGHGPSPKTVTRYPDKMARPVGPKAYETK